jgi:hypothetical protein
MKMMVNFIGRYKSCAFTCISVVHMNKEQKTRWIALMRRISCGEWKEKERSGFSPFVHHAISSSVIAGTWHSPRRNEDNLEYLENARVDYVLATFLYDIIYKWAAILQPQLGGRPGLNTLFRSTLGPTQPHMQWVPWAPSPAVSIVAWIWSFTFIQCRRSECGDLHFISDTSSCFSYEFSLYLVNVDCFAISCRLNFAVYSTQFHYKKHLFNLVWAFWLEFLASLYVSSPQ